jgi:hypothetical protein
MIAASLLELGVCLQDGPELFGCREILRIYVVVGPLWVAIVEVVQFFLAESKVR